MLAALAVIVSAAADETRYRFDLPPLRADRALNQLGQQTDRQILYPYEMARRSKANRLVGEYTFEEALKALLDGTGLKAVFSRTGDLAIVEDRAVTGQKEMSNVNKKSGLLAMLSALLASGAPDGAVAQERNPRVLEEVHITARRVEESLQDTPISVSAFSSDMLAKRQIFSSDDLDQITPNLQFTDQTTLAGNNSTSAIFIRGIGQTDPTSSVDPGVGLYIDDVYMGQSIGGAMDFRDIGSVQVLRGPQGTLFGKNTIGGAILLTTVEPGEEFGGNLRLGIGDDNLREVLAAVDIPLSDTLRSRFTAGLRKQDGYVERILTGEDLGDTNSYTLTGKLAWTPTDKLTARVSLDYTKEDENGIPFVFAAADETQTFMRAASAEAGCPGFNGVWNALPAVPMIPDLRCANDLMAGGPYKNYGTTPLESKTENWGMALHLQYDFNEAVTLKSISSYRKLDWTGVRDADNTPLTILVTDYDSSGEQFSQELQFLFSSDVLQGVVGAYYFEEEVDDLVLVVLNTPPPGLQFDSDNNITENSNWALFSQWTYDVSERLALTLGARYTEDTKGSTPDQFDYANPALKYLPVRKYEDTFESTTVSGTVTYRWNPSTMTYLSYSEGFKGGGWNSHFNRAQTAQEQAQFQKFDPEEAETVELGFKLDLFDNTMRLNGAVFTTDYTGLQFSYRVGVAPYLANAGEASIDGFELEVNWLPADDWTIDAGVGYLNTRIDKLRAIAGTAIGVEVGNELPFSPEWQANLGIGYSFTGPGGWSLDPRLDLTYQTRTYFDANNTEEIAQDDAVTVVNLSITLQPASEVWRLTAGLNNATDEEYAVGGNSSLTTSSGYAEIGYARPREWFLSLNYDY